MEQGPPTHSNSPIHQDSNSSSQHPMNMPSHLPSKPLSPSLEPSAHPIDPAFHSHHFTSSSSSSSLHNLHSHPEIKENPSTPTPTNSNSNAHTIQSSTPTPIPSISQPTPSTNNPSTEEESETAVAKKSDFECGVCYGLLCEPITVACGHTFCRVCLVTSLERRKKCPSCRAPCHIPAENQPANVLLTTLLNRMWPKEYALRSRESEEEKKKWSKKLPLFFTPTPMFPNQPLSLHLFEPRYKLMIRRVLAGNKCFGVMTTTNLKAGDVGTIFEVLECEFLADGRALLECVGRARFQVQQNWVEDGTQGLHYANIEELHDLPEADGFNPLAAVSSLSSAQLFQSVDESIMENAQQRINILCRSVRECMRDFIALVPQLTQLEQHYGPMPGGSLAQTETSSHSNVNIQDAVKLSFWATSILPISAAAKQELLGMTSTSTRLALTVQMLRNVLVDIRQRQQPQQQQPPQQPQQQQQQQPR